MGDFARVFLYSAKFYFMVSGRGMAGWRGIRPRGIGSSIHCKSAWVSVLSNTGAQEPVTTESSQPESLFSLVSVLNICLHYRLQCAMKALTESP